MCFECALEKSSVQVTAVASEFAGMDNCLRMWCKRRETVPGDGHCIVNSWTKVNFTTFAVDTVLIFLFVLISQEFLFINLPERYLRIVLVP